MTERKFIPLDRFLNDIKMCNELMPHYNFRISAIKSPDSFALSGWCPDNYDQAQLGSCTANAVLGVVKICDGISNNNADLELSRLFLYTQSLLTGNPGKPLEDTGSDAAIACTVLDTIGVCEEKYMPYIVDPFTKRVTNFGQYPSDEAIANAALHKYPMFKNVTWNGDKKETIKACISTGWPVLMAALVFPSFGKSSTNGGFVPMPSQEELQGPPSGGHQLVAVDYDEDYVTCFNSYGSEDGFHGFIKFPWEYIPKNFAIPQGSLAYCQQLLTLQQIPDFKGVSNMKLILASWPKKPSSFPVPIPVPPVNRFTIDVALAKVNAGIMNLFNLQTQLNQSKINPASIDLESMKSKLNAGILQLVDLRSQLDTDKLT